MHTPTHEPATEEQTQHEGQAPREDDGKPVVLPTPGDARAPVAPERRPNEPAQVHVASNPLALVTLPDIPTKESKAAAEQRDLNAIVHKLLTIGLVASATLMLLGVALALIYGRDLPTTAPTLPDTLRRVLALRPSGFLGLGLLVLIATPILRVVGSIVTFLYERDWRYAGVTSLVLLVLMISIVIGRG